jgi:hypothetical protein
MRLWRLMSSGIERRVFHCCLLPASWWFPTWLILRPWVSGGVFLISVVHLQRSTSRYIPEDRRIQYKILLLLLQSIATDTHILLLRNIVTFTAVSCNRHSYTSAEDHCYFYCSPLQQTLIYFCWGSSCYQPFHAFLPFSRSVRKSSNISVV